MSEGFIHSIKVPRLYKTASVIVKRVIEDGESLKQLIYEKKHLNIKALYALATTTLQHATELNEIVRKTQLFFKEPRLDPWLARVLITELFWGIFAVLKDRLNHRRRKKNFFLSLMVLIIGNRHIKSRVRTKFTGFFSESIQQQKQFNLLLGNNTNPLAIMSMAAVLGTLFIYSVAMFTLPFMAFFGVQHIMNRYHFDEFTINCSSVLVAVIVVNLIIAAYVYKAMNETDEPTDTNESHHEQTTSNDNEIHSKTD